MGENSVIPEEEFEEPELILDGGLPRYTTHLISDLLAEEEFNEMAVDEEEEEEEQMKDRAEEESGSLLSSPPSWEEWKLTSTEDTKGAKEVILELRPELKFSFCLLTESLRRIFLTPLSFALKGSSSAQELLFSDLRLFLLSDVEKREAGGRGG